jgi:type IV pilus assembly protein PilN
MIRVNLTGAERATQKRKGGGGVPGAPGAVQAYLFLALFGGGAALLCAALWWYESAKIRDLDSQIVVAEKRQKELQAIKVQVDALEAKRSTFQKKVDLIERLKAEQTGPVHMLDEISKALPDFVWVTAMDQTGPTVKFTGESTGLTSIADFIAALERSGWFPNVDLSSSVEANNIITYVLTSTFMNPEVAAKQAAAAAANKPIPGSTAATAAAPKR